MVAADGDILTGLLLRKFPSMRFVPSEYCVIFDERRLRRMRRADELELTYLPACHHPDHYHVQGWLVPEGWSPIWVGPFENGGYRIVNKPEAHITFGGIEEIRTDSNQMTRSEGSIWEWTMKSKERLRLFGQVKRLVQSFCTDWLLHVDPDTGLPKAGLKNFATWMGPHAAEWCRQHSLRSFEGLRPPPPGAPPDPRKTTGKPLRP